MSKKCCMCLQKRSPLKQTPIGWCCVPCLPRQAVQAALVKERTVGVGTLTIGDRFSTDQFPEGHVVGTVAFHSGKWTHIHIDGDEGLSCWPIATEVQIEAQS